MLFNTLALAALAAVPAVAETLYSVVVFTRHGDRTAKFFKGYHMTNLGATQLYESGNYYRQRYIETGASNRILNVSADQAVTSQLWASAPDQGILFQTANNFLQGLYPPLGQINETLSTETLTNGTETEGPLNGYQFILIHGEDVNSPDTIWIKGDDGCPVYDEAYDSYADSDEYKATLAETADFYSQFTPLLGSIMSDRNVSYSHAYDVFDLLNVGSIHNASVASSPIMTTSNLDQLRYHANNWEWHHNYNQTMPARSIGGMSFAGGVLNQMKSVVNGSAKVKFSLFAGSYDTQMSFYGLTNLTSASPDFLGLPNYAGSIAFELFTEEDNATRFPANPEQDLRVRFLFKNGTNDPELTAFPLFGRTELSMPYGEFVSELESRSINTVAQWCSTCQSESDFCVAALQNEDGSSSGSSSGTTSTSSGSGSGLSNAAAGGIGAGVTLAVVALVGALAWIVTRKKSRRSAPAVAERPGLEKKLSGSDSDGATNVV